MYRELLRNDCSKYGIEGNIWKRHPSVFHHSVDDVDDRDVGVDVLAYVRPCKYCFAIDRRRKNGIKVKRSTKEELIKDVRFLIHLPFQDPRLLCVEPLRSTRVNSIFLV